MVRVEALESRRCLKGPGSRGRKEGRPCAFPAPAQCCNPTVSSCLTVNGGSWSGEPPRRNSHTFNCRMLVKPLPDSEEEGHENQDAHQKYETMQCFAVSQPKSIKEEGEGRMALGAGTGQGEREGIMCLCPPPGHASGLVITQAGAHSEEQEATS